MVSDRVKIRSACLALAGLLLLTGCQPVRRDPAPGAETHSAQAGSPTVDASAAAPPVPTPDAHDPAPALTPELPPGSADGISAATEVGPPAPGRGSDVFARIRRNLSPNSCDAGSNSARWRKRYAGNPDAFARHLEQALPLMDFVSLEVERTGLPSEFVFIPLVESWYKPEAIGAGGPAGMWQMISSTARNHGIHITPGYDGRLSPVESTRAALSYLKVLQQMFGDWEAIVMAYNAGEGRMLNAFKRARSRDVSAAARRPHGMSNITYDYVAKLQALSCLISQPERSNLRLPASARFVPLQPVLVGSEHYTIEQFARSRGLDTGELRRLNPGYKSGRIVAGVPRLLLTPTYARVDSEQLAVVEPMPDTAPAEPAEVSSAPATPDMHEVRPGDSLWSIAKRYGLSVDALRRINGLGGKGLVRPGQKIRLSP
jgi:membrane-bound lytic murein transglycosylase D